MCGCDRHGNYIICVPHAKGFSKALLEQINKPAPFAQGGVISHPDTQQESS